MKLGMANRIKSAVKKHRQSLKRRARNQHVRSSLRTIIKKFHALIESNDTEGASTALRDVVRTLDKAATKGVIKKRTASRRVSRLSIMVHKLQA